MAIIKELREGLKNSPESYRSIARAIAIDHSMLLRFADGKKQLSLEAAERLADHLKLRLRSDE